MTFTFAAAIAAGQLASCVCSSDLSPGVLKRRSCIKPHPVLCLRNLTGCPVGGRIGSAITAAILLRGVLQSLGGLAHALEEAQTPLLQVRCRHEPGG